MVFGSFFGPKICTNCSLTHTHIHSIQRLNRFNAEMLLFRAVFVEPKTPAQNENQLPTRENEWQNAFCVFIQSKIYSNVCYHSLRHLIPLLWPQQQQTRFTLSFEIIFPKLIEFYAYVIIITYIIQNIRFLLLSFYSHSSINV